MSDTGSDLVSISCKTANVLKYVSYNSNRSLTRYEFFDLFQIKGSNSPYTLRTCAGVTETSGRRAMGFIAESLHGKLRVVLPTLIECNHMPDDRSEILSPEVAKHHGHFKSIAHMISCLDPEAQILILLGHASGPQNQGTRQWSTQRPLRTTTGPWMGRHKGCVPWVPSSTAPKQSGPSLQKTALRCTFKRKPKTKADFVAFMQNIYNCDQAEWAPLLMEISECWYLSIFGVYHPQKPNKIWVVFNSSTQHH